MLNAAEKAPLLLAGQTSMNFFVGGAIMISNGNLTVRERLDPGPGQSSPGPDPGQAKTQEFGKTKPEDPAPPRFHLCLVTSPYPLFSGLQSRSAMQLRNRLCLLQVKNTNGEQKYGMISNMIPNSSLTVLK